MSTFLTGDLHLGHKNSHGGIVTMCNRPFESVPHMDSCFIANNNAVVSPDDEVIDLGDFAFRCSPNYAVECLQEMNGRRTIILGNHDKPIRQAWKRGWLKDLIDSGRLTIVGTPNPKEWITKQFEIEGSIFICSHLAHRTWPRAFRKSIHCFGHSHNNLSPFYRSRDVGVDANNYFPINAKDVIKWADSLSHTFEEK